MDEPYDEAYYDPGRYGGKYSQYWWARRFYAALIKRFLEKGKVLEIGCGLGHVLARLENDYETFGIDVSEYAIEQARTNSPKSDLRTAAMEEAGSLPGPFDLIATFHVVEHLDDPGRALEHLWEMTRPGGLLCFATPNTEAPFAQSKGAQWYANQDPTHISLKSPREWKELTRRAGYEIQQTFGDGMWDVPYVPFVPPRIQLLFFGLPAVLQTLTCVPLIPTRFSESLILVARRPLQEA